MIARHINWLWFGPVWDWLENQPDANHPEYTAGEAFTYYHMRHKYQRGKTWAVIDAVIGWAIVAVLVWIVFKVLT